MAKRWMSVALIAAGLSWASNAQAQCCDPGCYSGWPCDAPMVCGPLNPYLAPPGHGPDLSLDPDSPNAFDPPRCPERADYCCNGFWFSAEYLLWWFRDPSFITAPLLTSNPTVAPVIGAAGTVVLVDRGGLQYNDPWSGARINAGFWLNSDRTWSIEGSGFTTERRGQDRSFASTGAPLLGIPFFNVVTGAEAAQVFASAAGPGTVSVTSSSRLWGADGNVAKFGECACVQVGLLVGFRYFDLSETVTIEGAQFGAGGAVANALQDQFTTRNQFYGGQVGLRVATCLCSCLFFAAEGKFALGSNHEIIVIQGRSATAGAIALDGLFARATNSGRFERNQFAMIPQATAKVGLQINRYLMIHAGYDFLYWYQAVRPGNQIDRLTTPIGTAPVGPNPALPFSESHFWAQGANFGFEMRW
jgi:hypothetical protein